MGTRVLKHFNGYRDPFGGSIDGYTESTGYYHVTYDDGDSEEMTESDVELYKQPTPKAATSPRIFQVSTSPKAAVEALKTNNHNVSVAIPAAEDVGSLLNKRVIKNYIDTNGKDAFMNGTVLTYFPATNKYRVLYMDGQCDDLTLEEVTDMIPLSPKSREEAKTRKLQLANELPSAAKPKTAPKQIESPKATTPSTSTLKIAVPKQRPSIQIEPEPAVPVMDSSFALKIVRNALYVMISTAPNSTDLKTKLLTLLLKDDLEVKDRQYAKSIELTLMLHVCVAEDSS